MSIFGVVAQSARDDLHAQQPETKIAQNAFQFAISDRNVANYNPVQHIRCQKSRHKTLH